MMPPKGSDGMTRIVNPDQTTSLHIPYIKIINHIHVLLSPTGFSLTQD